MLRARERRFSWLSCYRMVLMFLRVPGMMMLGLLGLLDALAAVCAQAQPGDIGPGLDNLRAQLDRVQKTLASLPEEAADLSALRAQALSAGTQAKAAAALLEPQLTSIQARMDKLGPPVPG